MNIAMSREVAGMDCGPSVIQQMHDWPTEDAEYTPGRPGYLLSEHEQARALIAKARLGDGWLGSAGG